MLYFPTRAKARTFSAKSPKYQFVDNGTAAKKRWAVKVI